MKIVSWNVNSVKARLERLKAFLIREAPDVVCLQELKCVEEAFPLDEIRGLGYEAAVFGQKTYNGVAILSRKPLKDIERGFQDGVEDAAARMIAATIENVRVLSVYVPNGQEIGAPAYSYKLEWLRRLRSYLERTSSTYKLPLVVGGDFNVAPEDRDVHDPIAWEGKILFSEPEKKALENVTAFGLIDTFRKYHTEKGLYSWWDYRQLAFPFNKGLRIDFLLASSDLAERCTAASIDRDERKGEKPSDHAPVIAEFNC